MTKDNMDNFPFVPMEVVERSLREGGTYFLIQTAQERNGWEVAEVRPDIPWQLKTANLLAAAPELLEALQALELSAPEVCCADFNHFNGDFHEADEACPPLDRWHAACLAARAAIAKAKGQQHD